MFYKHIFVTVKNLFLDNMPQIFYIYTFPGSNPEMEHRTRYRDCDQVQTLDQA